MALDYTDRTDFKDAERGFVASIDPVTITNAEGRTVFDLAPYQFLNGDPADTVNPSLWRQAQLCIKNGLFEVTPGLYQVRGFDISNMTIIEGDTGVVIVDPLVSAEVAAAGIALYRAHRGDRPVTGVIYTHCHPDHFGGVMGVLHDGAGEVPIIAPAGFMDHAVTEWVYAGTAMNRRATFQYGNFLDVGPEGLVGTGLGVGNSTGTLGLLAPTLDITHTGQEETIDGVRIVFQITPGTEAPAEMNFYFPDHRALCMAENATHNLHNILTLRGAVVRDARAWARYINEAIELFGADTDVVFASHHWPTWDTERIIAFLTQQRDLYAYLHDQTLRMMNQGLTGIEIAEDITLPPALDDAWHARGYYGSVSHNVKAIYQRYLGWYDGHPTSLWQHPPQAQATRYVQAFGGIDVVLDKAREFAEAGDLRFAAELLKHAVFADPDNAEAKSSLADVYTDLGYGAENPTWRNYYLTGAHELRHGVTVPPIDAAAGMATALSVEQMLESLAIRIDGPRAAAQSFTIDWRFTETNATIRLALSNGALIQTENPRTRTNPDLALTLTKTQLLGLLAGHGLDGIDHTGDPTTLQRLLDLLDNPDPAFAIITP